MPITNPPPCGCGEWLVRHFKQLGLGRRTVTLLGSFLFYFLLPKNHDLLSGGVPRLSPSGPFCYKTFLFFMYEYMLIYGQVR